MCKIRVFIIICACFVYANIAFSSIIDLGYYECMQPNGYIFTVHQSVDEFGFYTCNKNGLVEKRNSDGYYYYCIYGVDGKTKLSDIRVGIDESSRKIDILDYKIQGEKNWREFTSKVSGRSKQLTKGLGKIASASVPDSLIVVLVDFTPPLRRPYTRANFEDLLFRDGYVSPTYYTPDNDTVYGSLRDYYEDMSASKSGGSWTLKGRIINPDSASTNIPKWVILPNSKNYYSLIDLKQHS